MCPLHCSDLDPGQPVFISMTQPRAGARDPDPGHPGSGRVSVCKDTKHFYKRSNWGQIIWRISRENFLSQSVAEEYLWNVQGYVNVLDVRVVSHCITLNGSLSQFVGESSVCQWVSVSMSHSVIMSVFQNYFPNCTDWVCQSVCLSVGS